MLPDAHEAAIDFSTTEDALAGIVVQEAGVEGGVAKDNEALTLLDYHKTRNMFIDDIMEVFIHLRRNNNFNHILTLSNILICYSFVFFSWKLSSASAFLRCRMRQTNRRWVSVFLTLIPMLKFLFSSSKV